MNILITGIHGFVGNNLVDALSGRHRISGMDIVAPAREGVERTYGWDELDMVPAPDVIIHLAGKAEDTRRNADEQAYFEVNAGLTQKIMDFFLASPAGKFIFFSSVKAVADRVTGDLTEDALPEPLTSYGKSKLAAEKYILGKPLPGEKKVYILRPCMIHGPGNRGNLNLLYKWAKHGLPWPLGSFENRRSFTSVQNLQFIVQRIVENEITPGIYNVADDEPLSTNDIIRMIAGLYGKPARIWKIGRRLVAVSAKAGDFFRLPVNSERLAKLTGSYTVSNSRLKNALGIDHMPVTASEGMKRTMISFSQQP